MNIYSKIAKAKDEIKSTSLKKDGRNEFSKYNYFTPDQIEHLVFTACKNNGLVTKFDLKRNEFGEVGYLSVINLESDETVVYEMATKIPDIKATNAVQQLGGCVTYTERYLKMSAFGITQNDLDPDQDKQPEKKQPESKPYKNAENNDTANRLTSAMNEGKDCKDLADLERVWNKYKDLQAYETFILFTKNQRKRIELDKK